MYAVINSTTMDNTTSVQEEERRIDIELKRLQAQEKRAFIENWELRRIADSEERIKIDKIYMLKSMLESTMIDCDRTYVGSEPTPKPTFSEAEQHRIKEKIFKILSSF